MPVRVMDIIVSAIAKEPAHKIIMKAFKKNGFTLIELVVSIGVLSILAAFAITALDPFSQFQKSNDARRKSDLSQIQKALEQYYQDNEHYPASDNSFRIMYQNSSLDWGKGPWGPYMDVLPKDPVSTFNYVYYSAGPTYQSYYLYARLEKGSKDPQACNNTGASCTNGSSCTCSSIPGGAVCGSSSSDYCNFGISSPNVAP